MESLLMVVVLHALFLHQGLHGAAISSNENGTDTRRSDDVEKRSTGGSLHTASISKHCSETLMALHHGRWVSVTLTQQSNETKKDMAQFCKDLDCGGIFAENGTASMNTCLSDCTIINSNLYNCTDAAPDNCSNVVEVLCAWQVVQLIGGSDRCAGRVELFGHGGWGSVCDDGWDLKGGNVVCAQLDCGTALRVMGKDGDFEAGSGPIHINHINCSGTERNLWQCSTKMNRGRNYCGHKEDASVVCSGSSYIPVTTVNTLMTDVTNWTTETVTVVAAEDNSSGISPPVLGCIVLSVTLLLLMLSNAGQCAYYKRQNGGLESRSASQALQQDNSETSSDSENENYYNPDPTPPTAVNNYEHNLVDYSRDTNQEQTRFCEGRNAVQTNALDSESTSSGECYENIEPVMENLLSPDINPEYCIQMTPLHNNSESANNGKDDSFDSDSTSSGECYENTVEEGPSLPEQPPLVHPLPHLAGNSSVSQPYSPDQEIDQELMRDMSYNSFKTTLSSTPVILELESEATVGTDLPKLESQSLGLDDSSTSSEEPYENVAEIDNSYFARSEQSVNSSSDSDYDDVGNW